MLRRVDIGDFSVLLWPWPFCYLGFRFPVDVSGSLLSSLDVWNCIVVVPGGFCG